MSIELEMGLRILMAAAYLGFNFSIHLKKGNYNDSS